MIVITFVSNYINHHQLPFCEAMNKRDDVEFHFVQTSPMEQKRIDMGWAVDTSKYSYVSLLYDDRKKCENLILDSDVTILGWSDGLIKDTEKKRLSSGKLTFRVSERIYREGQWKFISPKGLFNKYFEHIRYRKAPVFLLCAGAYVASDFALIHSYPGKMLKWGYFPKVEACENLTDRNFVGFEGGHKNGKVRLCWAGRLIELKHPEFAIQVACVLKDKGYDFSLDMIGDGEEKKHLEGLVESFGLENYVKLHGSKKPLEVLEYMKNSDVFLFTSNYLEGWGAVVNEAMQCECAVVASKEAGAVPFLIEDGVNGLCYSNGSYEDFEKKVLYLFKNQDKIAVFSKKAKETTDSLWNAENAASELIRFSMEYLKKKRAIPAKRGPMSVANVIKAPGIKRTLQERNVLE